MSIDVSGRWDLVVGEGSESFPSWVELAGEGSRFVGQVGSARPVPTVRRESGKVFWSLPKQYEGRSSDLEFIGRLEGEELVGTTTLDDGTSATWRGRRAPVLARTDPPRWGSPVELIGEDREGWTLRTPELGDRWRIEDGMLVNEGVGSDLVTKDRFMDFKLVAEYKYPPKSNSGIYLRGRYEVQILDDYGQSPTAGTSGAIYGFIAPAVQAVKPAEEWNVAEITLLGRRVTVVLNGQTVVNDEEIPGITGGALDSEEGVPGPLFLQGDHGPVTFRRLTITTAE